MASPEFIVRTAVETDVPAVVALLAQLSLGDEVREGDPRDPLYVQQFRRMAQNGGHLFVALDGVRVVGTATLNVVYRLSLRASVVGSLENVVVHREARGKGVGEALVHFSIERARALGCERVELTSRRERVEAHRFWEKCGFVASHVGFKRHLREGK